ncbi:MAG: TonB-dependent receptor [Novosphingobium sp.]
MPKMRCLGLLLAGASLFATAPAHAQENADAPDRQANGEDERIIVVSIKNPGPGVDDYPASVATIGSVELEQRQVQDLSSLTYVAPNVSIDPIGTFKGVANFSIRGLGINSSIPSIDPAVGLFIDGVYMGINAGTVFDLLDVERIDVLRGPQGVAFGRNTTGGAILVTTADPTWDWQGHADLSFETPVDGGRGAPMATARAIASGPLSHNVRIRLGVLHSDDGGYFKNAFNGSDFGASRTTVIRGALAIDATDRLFFTVKGEWTDSRGDGAATHNNGQNARNAFDLSVNQEGFYRSETGFAVLRADYELDIGVITNVFGWRNYKLSTRNDIDSTPETIFESDTGTRQEQWSNELYYTADYGTLSLTLGGYFFHQDIAYNETRSLPPFTPLTFYGGGSEGHDIYGLYGQADFELTRSLTLSAGLRWSREEKDADITFVRPRPECSTIAGTCPTEGINPTTGEGNGFTDSRSWNSLSPRIAISFTPVNNANLYASWTRGQRSGGYNLRITQPAAFEEVAATLGSPAFDQERVDSFEIGAKWRSQDGRARINAAAFWTEVDNLQREVNVPSATSGLAQSVYNTADARIRGGELEAEFLPVPALRLTANLGYIDADYRRVFFDINSDGAIDRGDLSLELPRAPEWTWGGTANYQVLLGRRKTLSANVWFQHRSRYAYTDNNWGYNTASDRLDANLSLNLGKPDITFSLYGKNLLDDVQFGGDTQLPFGAGAFSDGNNRPFDPNPAAGTFSPVFKGRILGFEVAMDF